MEIDRDKIFKMCFDLYTKLGTKEIINPHQVGEFIQKELTEYNKKRSGGIQCHQCKSFDVEYSAGSHGWRCEKCHIIVKDR